MQEPLQFPDAPSRAQSDRILNWMSKRFGGGKGCAWIIADREGGAPVGAIRINRIDRGWRWGEIGYESHPDFWDRGLMTEAVRAVVFCAASSSFTASKRGPCRATPPRTGSLPRLRARTCESRDNRL
jgi:RimJ/RimL family protein N-acetyltransferase